MAGFFVRGSFTFHGVKWRWGWVAVLPVRPFLFLTLHSRGTGRMRSLHGLWLLNFRWLRPSFAVGQPLNLNVRAEGFSAPFGFAASLKPSGYGQHRCPSRPPPFWPGGHRRRWRASAVASTGFFVRGNFTFRGVKWLWDWVVASPVSLFPVLTLHSSGTGR